VGYEFLKGDTARISAFQSVAFFARHLEMKCETASRKRKNGG
jgi:hypothetical protein